MSGEWSRRRLLAAGLSTAAAVSGLAVAKRVADQLRSDPAGLWRHLGTWRNA